MRGHRAEICKAVDAGRVAGELVGVSDIDRTKAEGLAQGLRRMVMSVGGLLECLERVRAPGGAGLPPPSLA